MVREAGGAEAGVAAWYFDGRTSRRHAVSLSALDGVVRLRGEHERSCALRELRVSERSRHALRKVTFPDGAYLEIADGDAFARLLADTGHRDGWVVRCQQSWRGALAACAAAAVVIAALYIYVLPAAARAAAQALPLALERRLGDGVLELLDRKAFSPSRLPLARQRQLTAAFGALTPPAAGPAAGPAPSYRILFRKSEIGPNAFALPSGDIVVTDEIVALVGDDAALRGVLAHELGHLHQRHLTQRLLQASAVGALAAVFFGDVSTLIGGVPALLADAKYSRDAEREADDYALAMFEHNGVPAAQLEQVFRRLGTLGEGPMPYLSTHPVTAERLARVRGAGAPGAAGK